MEGRRRMLAESLLLSPFLSFILSFFLSLFQPAFAPQPQIERLCPRDSMKRQTPKTNARSPRRAAHTVCASTTHLCEARCALTSHWQRTHSPVRICWFLSRGDGWRHSHCRLLLISPGPGEAGLRERPGTGGRSGTEGGGEMCGGKGFRALPLGRCFSSDCAHGSASINQHLSAGVPGLKKCQSHAEEGPKLVVHAEKAKQKLVALQQRFWTQWCDRL